MLSRRINVGVATPDRADVNDVGVDVIGYSLRTGNKGDITAK
jgi:hypothetical protein